MKQLLTLLAVLAISTSATFGQKSEQDSLKLINTHTSYNKNDIDIALSYPQLTIGDKITDSTKIVASKINSEVCRTIASIAPVTDAVVKDSMWKQVNSPQTLEQYTVKVAKQLLTEMKGYGGLPDYDLYSEWTAFGNKQLVSIFIKTYIFTGGAHGMTIGRTLNYDVTTGNRIDILQEIEDTAFMMDLAAKYFCKERQLPKNAIRINTGLFFELADLPFPDQLGFSAKGMVLYYDPYSIAPYSYGPIAITIPYREVDDIVDPSFFKMKVASGGAKTYNEKVRIKEKR